MWVMSGVPDVVGAFGWSELVEQSADAVPDVCNASLVGFSQLGLELGEHHLDRVQVGTPVPDHDWLQEAPPSTQNSAQKRWLRWTVSRASASDVPSSNAGS